MTTLARRSLRLQLVLMASVLIAVLSVLFWIAVWTLLTRQAEDALVAKARSLAAVTAYTAGPAMVFEDVTGIDETFAGARLDPDFLYLVAIDNDGRRVADEGAPEMLPDLPGDGSHLVDGQTVHVAVPIVAVGRTIGRLQIGMSLANPQAQVAQVSAMVAALSLVAFVVGVAAVFGIGTLVTRPLRAIARTMERISGGQTLERAPVAGSSEVAGLAAQFNRMVDGLEAARQALEDANQQLEARVAARTRELQNAQDRLLQAQKMEAVGQLAGGVAHDFNTLLTAVLGYGDMALAQLPRDSPAASDIAQMMNAGRRGADLTRQLLAFSRRQALQPTVLDLNATLADVHGILQRLIGEHVTLSIRADPELGAVFADATQMQQVIMNLAVNASDAMPNGGSLTIGSSNVSPGECDRVDPVLPRASYVCLTVRDTGIGMTPYVQAHLFEPFFTTKGPGAGTGLGLATVYGIVKQSGGFVFCRTAPDRGAEFRVLLPRVDATPAAAHKEPAREPARGTETVLVVEDETAVRLMTTRVLRGAGYTVIEAPNGPAALDAAAAHRGPLHLLLTDMLMPGMNGRKLAERLVAARPTIKVLVCSGYVAATLGEQTLPEGWAFLAKPYAREQLLLAMRAVLDGVGAGRHS